MIFITLTNAVKWCELIIIAENIFAGENKAVIANGVAFTVAAKRFSVKIYLI
jgi:hypothetical protein